MAYYWTIEGFGVEVTKDMFDDIKVKNKGAEDTKDFLCAITYGPIRWASTEDMYDINRYFVYIPARMPWMFAETDDWHQCLNAHRDLTREKAVEQILDILRPYLKPGLEDDLRENMGYISLVGCDL